MLFVACLMEPGKPCPSAVVLITADSFLKASATLVNYLIGQGKTGARICGADPANIVTIEGGSYYLLSVPIQLFQQPGLEIPVQEAGATAHHPY